MEALDRVIWGEFNKVDFENRIVEGCFTSEAVDIDNDIVDYDATKEAVAEWDKWRNIREMHLPIAVGVAVDIILDDKERKGYLRAKIVDDAAWKKVVERVYKGFSIGAKVLKARYENGIRRWLKYRLNEVSLADRPKNPDALFAVAKCLYPDEEVQEVEDQDNKAIRRREDVSDADIRRAIEEYGDLPDSKWGDPTNKKYPLDTEKHVRAAWAYINMPKNQRRYSEAEVNTIKERIRRAAKEFGIELSDDKALSSMYTRMESLSEKAMMDDEFHETMRDMMKVCGCEKCIAGLAVLEDKACDDDRQQTKAEGTEGQDGQGTEQKTEPEQKNEEDTKNQDTGQEQKNEQGTDQKADTGQAQEDKNDGKQGGEQPPFDFPALKAQMAEELKAALGGLLDEKVAPLTEGLGRVASVVEELRGRVEKLEAQPEPGGPVLKTSNVQLPLEVLKLEALKATWNEQGDPHVRDALGKQIALMETKLIQGGIK